MLPKIVILGSKIPSTAAAQHVWNMDCLPRQSRSPGSSPMVNRLGVLAPIPLGFAGKSVVRDKTNQVAVPPKDKALIQLAKPRGELSQLVEHSLQVEGRTADDLEYVGGRRLLL